ncbi:hypothetical protein BGZ49_007865 [Haplosporangium sp. Z 27]|nr:hypothetical protein BGZ49_007865 [Haplosporangium sp. Z 27]
MFSKYTAFFLLLISSILISNVQSYQPLVTYAASSAFVEGQAIYILGGLGVANATSTSSNFIQQSFMIDLSQSWNTTNPVYKKLSNGPTATAYSVALSPNGQDLIVFANGTAFTYDLKSNTWSLIYTNSYISRTNGLSAVTDPKAGVVYVPYGYNGVNSSWYTSSMLAIKVSTNAISSIPMDPAINSTYYYATAWSAQYSSLYILSSGGTTSNLFTYTSALGWKDMTSIQNGYIPSPRSSACLVSAFGGSKLILFGGVDPTRTTSLSDIYTLDVSTMTWTRGPDVDQTNSRAFASCAFSKGSFIVWGGANAVNGNAIVPQDNILVFDTTTGNWTTEYNSSPSSNNSTSGGDNNPSSPSGSHTIITVCIVIVVVVVLLAAAAVLFYRRRSRSAQVSGDNNNSNNNNEEKSMGFSDKESYHSSYSTSNPQQMPKRIPAIPPPPPPSLSLSSPSSPATIYYQANKSNRGFQQPVVIHHATRRADYTFS